MMQMVREQVVSLLEEVHSTTTWLWAAMVPVVAQQELLLLLLRHLQLEVIPQEEVVAEEGENLLENLTLAAMALFLPQVRLVRLLHYQKRKHATGASSKVVEKSWKVGEEEQQVLAVVLEEVAAQRPLEQQLAA